MSDIYSATMDQILNDAYLYNLCVKEMKKAGMKVHCNCGKNKRVENVENFIKNKNIIIDMNTKVKNRTIMPKWHGLLYSSKLMKHINSESITDESALNLIEQGLSRDLFDFSKYEGKSEEKIEENDEKSSIVNKNPEISEEAKKEMIKGLKNEGYSNKEIANHMNELGITTSKGGKFFPINVNNYLK